MKKKITIFLIIILSLAACIFFFYLNNLSLVDSRAVLYYKSLKDSLKSQGFSPNLLVISTKRIRWHNKIQVKLSGAATKSRHLSGEAIDFLVFDVNKDGKSDFKDVNIVYDILDKNIIKNSGGIGTYKNEKGFINRQMIHIDCRGYSARWAR